MASTDKRLSYTLTELKTSVCKNGCVIVTNSDNKKFESGWGLYCPSRIGYTREGSPESFKESLSELMRQEKLPADAFYLQNSEGVYLYFDTALNRFVYAVDVLTRIGKNHKQYISKYPDRGFKYNKTY